MLYNRILLIRLLLLSVKYILPHTNAPIHTHTQTFNAVVLRFWIIIVVDIMVRYSVICDKNKKRNKFGHLSEHANRYDT